VRKDVAVRQQIFRSTLRNPQRAGDLSPQRPLPHHFGPGFGIRQQRLPGYAPLIGLIEELRAHGCEPRHSAVDPRHSVDDLGEGVGNSDGEGRLG
jgi:hypothetical protein